MSNPPLDVINEIYFSHRGRLSRSCYICATVCFTLFSLPSALVLVGLCNLLLPGLIKIFVMFVYVFFLLYSAYILIVKRLHDLDRSGWLALVVFVPYINILFYLWLLLGGGSRGGNRFGPPCAYRPPTLLARACYLVAALWVVSWSLFLPKNPFVATTNPKSVQELIAMKDNLLVSGLVKTEREMEKAMALVSVEGKFVCAAVFLSSDRIIVYGTDKREAIGQALSEGRGVRVVNFDKEGTHIIGMVASHEDPSVEVSVFEVAEPIGTPGPLGEEDKKVLMGMGALR